jgi:hypothetical protein
MEIPKERWLQVFNTFENKITTGSTYGYREIMQQYKYSERHSRYISFVLENLELLKDALGGNVPSGKNEKIVDYKEDTATVTTRSANITNLEKALEYAEVDLSVWEVDRHIINSWEVTMGKDNTGTGKPETLTNYQVKVWLKRKDKNLIADGVLQYIKDADLTIPKVKLITNTRKKYIAAELAPVDAHFGKFAWHPECLAGHMDTEIAGKVFIDSCRDNLEKISRWEPSKIFFVVGNDLMHIENVLGQTPFHHNQLDFDSRLPKIIKKCKESLITVIDTAIQLAPTEIVWIPGNHDITGSYWLCEILTERYRANKHVTIDNSPAEKKCRLWGDLLVAWTHDASGRKQNPTINMLPQFWPELWGQSRFREWHTGHKHKSEVTKITPVTTVGGTIVRQLSALSNIDKWHLDNMFVDAVPSCESFIWDKSMGIRAQYPSFIDYLKFRD